MRIVSALMTAADEGEDLVPLPQPDEAKALRLGAGVSTAEIAAAVGVSVKSVERWLAGTHTPRNLADARRYGRVLAVLQAHQSGRAA